MNVPTEPKNGSRAPAPELDDLGAREHDAWEPFGYKTSWLAVRGASSEAVANALDLGRFTPCTWRAGVPGAKAGLAVFVTPPVDGFVLVVGDLLGAQPVAELEARVLRLSAQFGEGQLFVSQRVTDVYVCLRALHGVLENRSVFGAAVPVPCLAMQRVTDETEVLATAARWSVDPTQLGHPEPPAPGLAAPDPTSPAPRLVKEIALRQQPAASRREAEVHFRSAFQACPACGDQQIALHLPGRDALPWEAFALALSISCSNGRCGVRHRVEYPAAPTFALALAPDDPRWSASAEPSRLMNAEACLALLGELLASLEEMPAWGYPPELLASESRTMARQALGAALELGRTEPGLVGREQLEWLRSVAQDGLVPNA